MMGWEIPPLLEENPTHAYAVGGGALVLTLEGPTGLVLVQQWPCHDPPVFFKEAFY